MFSGSSMADLRCMEKLAKDYLIEGGEQEDSEGGISESPPSLSIKEHCEQHKATATVCCSNPNHCSGLFLDIFQNVTPLAPALYQTYEGIRASKDINSDNLSHEEAVHKMCNVGNDVAVGTYGTQLLAQLTPLLQKTCAGKIKKCEKKCNNHIEAFRNDFKRCFGSKIPFDIYDNRAENITDFVKDVLDDIDLAQEKYRVKSLEEIDLDECHVDAEINTENEAKAFENCFVRVQRKSVEDTLSEEIEEINGRTIGYILLFSRAYRNSSSVREFNKMNDLTDKSDEKQIVNCSDQPDRIVTQRRGPSSGPVSPPFIQLCEKIVNQQLNNEPPEPEPENPNKEAKLPPPHPGGMPNPTGNTFDSSGSFAGQLPDGRQPSWMFPKKGQHGIQEEEEVGGDWKINDELPDPLNKPPLAKITNPSNGSPRGGGPGGGPGGGGLPAGAGPGPLSDDGSDSSGSYAGSKTSGGSFPGSGGGYKGATGGPGMRHMRAKAPATKGKGKKKKPAISKKDKKNKPDQKGLSIFQIASERIQTFCADWTCLE